MATKAMKERAPQNDRPLWLALARLAYLVQTAVGVGTKLTEKLDGAKLGEAIPQAPAGLVFLDYANRLMAKRCKAKCKDFAKHEIVLTAQNVKDTPRTVRAKLNSLRNWYQPLFVYLDAAVEPYSETVGEDGKVTSVGIKRDAFGNVERALISVPVDGTDDTVIDPKFDGKYSQAQWPDFDGIPDVAGRSRSNVNLTDDSDDYDF